MWKGIPHFSAYEASEAGGVRRKATQRILRPSECRSSGYAKVTIINDDGALKTVAVHRAVCLAFHGDAKPGWQARHLDGNKRNCAASNLQWGTRSDNAADRKNHMTQKNKTYAGLKLRIPVTTHLSDEDLGKFLGGTKNQWSIRRAYRNGLISKNKALELLNQIKPP